MEVQKVEGLPWRFTKLTCTGRRRHWAGESSLDPCFGCCALHMHSFTFQHLANWHFDQLLYLGITSREGNSYDPPRNYFTPQSHTWSLLKGRPLLAPSLFAMLGRNMCTLCYRQWLSPRCLTFLLCRLVWGKHSPAKYRSSRKWKLESGDKRVQWINLLALGSELGFDCP